MTDKKIMNRWLVVLGAILIQLALGAIYAWSVFTPALTATSPTELVAQYGAYHEAPMLDITQTEFDQMKAGLAELKKEARTLDLKERVTEDKAEKAALAEQKREVTATMDGIILKYVDQQTLDGLTYRYTKTQTQVIFALGLAFFALVMIYAGRKIKTWGPRNLAIIGGIVLGLGYVLAGLFAGTSFWLNAIFIGVVGGAGIGLAYVVPIAVGIKWFPDKKGMITGLAVAGFGFGAMGWVKLAGSWGHLINDIGIPQTFLIYGVAYALMVIVGGLWMVFPPEGWKPAGYMEQVQTGGGKKIAAVRDFKSGEMLRTVQFYLIFFTFIFSAGAGLMSIGLMKLYPIEVLRDSGMDAVAASAIAGTAMAVFFSLANGLGRILWGMLSDKIGRKISIIIMTATQGILVLLFTYMAGNEYLLYLGATLIGFNYGGIFALFPTVTADIFGTRNIGQNYPFVFLAYGIG
ncbi:MAG: OFA family MFS transporter, partial [Bacteroidales bacterium]|nr:OFA family MFS transporter [Bacteroidales bacterium]